MICDLSVDFRLRPILYLSDFNGLFFELWQQSLLAHLLPMIYSQQLCRILQFIHRRLLGKLDLFRWISRRGFVDSLMNDIGQGFSRGVCIRSSDLNSRIKPPFSIQRSGMNLTEWGELYNNLYQADGWIWLTCKWPFRNGNQGLI